MISFGSSRCVLRADPGFLTLRAEAPDEQRQARSAGGGLDTTP
jgi:hypothetical protein